MHPTPLQVLLALMQRAWVAEDTDEAAALARAAAPYVHVSTAARASPAARARPAAKPKHTNSDMSQLTDAELDALGDDGNGVAPEAEAPP